MKIRYFKKPINRNRKDSFWFDGQIADTKFALLVATGEIKVRFTEKGEWQNEYQAFAEAIRRKYTDKDIAKLYNKDYFANNNWFEVFYKTPNGRIENDLGPVCYDYDEAIKTLTECSKENENFKLFKRTKL